MEVVAMQQKTRIVWVPQIKFMLQQTCNDVIRTREWRHLITEQEKAGYFWITPLLSPQYLLVKIAKTTDSKRIE